jgi:phenylalanyl-tRNA synthetase beta chain
MADRLRNLLTGLGLHEAVTLPLGPKVSDAQPAVRNPLSQEEAYLRHDLLAGLVRRTEHNWRQMSRDVRLFEIGHVFDREGGRREAGGGREYTLPHEENRVAGVISGARRPVHWSEPAPPDGDIFDVKAILEAVVAVASPEAVVAAEGDGWVVRQGTTAIGRAGELDADRPAWAAPLIGFELLLADAVKPAAPRYAPVPAWPAVVRDVALVVPDGISAAEVEATLRSAAGKLLERLWAMDEYRGKPLAAGERSVTWRLVFRAPDRTLREDDADKALAKAARTVEDRHGIRRREA